MVQYSKTGGKAGDPNNTVATPGEVTQLVMQEARRRGLTWFQPYHAAGMVGSFIQETGNFRKDVLDFQLRGDDGSAHGLMQWRGARFQNLINYSKGKNIDPKNIRTQIAFAFEEGAPNSRYADGGSVRAFKDFRSARNERDAAVAFVHAERPAGYDGNPNNAHDVDRRINHAKKAITDFGEGSNSQTSYLADPNSRNDPDYRTSPNAQNSNQPNGGLNVDGFQDPLAGARGRFGLDTPSDEYGNENTQSQFDNGVPQGLTLDTFGLQDFIYDSRNNPFLNAQGADKNTGDA